MWNKILSVVLCLCMAFLPTIVLADEPLLPPKGKITGLRYKQPAPYSGVLLNSVAAAKLLTSKDFSEKQWELKLQYELAKLRAELSLVIESQKVSYSSLKDKHTEHQPLLWIVHMELLIYLIIPYILLPFLMLSTI